MPQTPREVGYALTDSAGHRTHVSCFQGRVDLLGGQRHRAARRAIHRAARRRTARVRDPERTKATRRVRIGEMAGLIADYRLGLGSICKPILRSRSSCWSLASSVCRSMRAQLPQDSREQETAWVCPMHSDYTMDVDRQLSALRHGPGARRAFRRTRLPTGLPDRARRLSGPVQKATLRFSIFHPGTGEADQEIRSRARAAVPPLRHQPGHGVLPAHPPGAAAGRHVVDRRDAAEGGVLQGSLGLPSRWRRGAVPRPAARDARAMPATWRPTAPALSRTPI